MALDAREVVSPEQGLTPDVVRRLRERIAEAGRNLEDGRAPLQYVTVGQSRDSDFVGVREDRESVIDSGVRTEQ